MASVAGDSEIRSRRATRSGEFPNRHTRMEDAVTADVEIFEDLDAAGRDAGGALARDARPILFDRLDWYRMVDRYTPPRGKKLIIRSADKDARAWLFLAREGAAAEPLSNWYCLRYGPIVETRNGSPAPLGALATGL